MKLLLAFCLFLFNFASLAYATDTPHPLRPFPGQPIETTNPSFLTPYCASRPTAIQSNKFDKRDKTITLKVQGNLNSNFTEFITPLLSITNTEKPDYDLEYEQQAKRYLTDYLEGRAYYEPEAESPSDLLYLQKVQQTTQLTNEELQIIQSGGWTNEIQSKVESGFMMSRYGVFRKLAPSTYQDKLKRILIKRGHGDYKTLEELEEIYGYKPSSVKVNPKTPVQSLTINDFYENWAPLPEEFNSWEDYEIAYNSWTGCDENQENCSQWFNLWPYVPMFTREDSVGQIITYDEPGQNSNPPIVEKVYHPHLARTYEVASVLSNMLSPQKDKRLVQDPKLSSQWITPAPWKNDPFWIDSGQNLPPDSGSVCDPQNTLILSSGDLALDSAFDTTVNKTITIDNPEYDPDAPDCAVWVDDPNGGHWDESDCDYTIPVRFSPTSFQTLTPFLAEITDRLTTGQFALFNIFRSSEEIKANPPENWPGVGYEPEENPEYTPGDSAEAGLKNPGNTAKYFYKYLGWVHCQKENLLARLSPANTYVPFADECNINITESKTPPPFSASGDICAIAKEYNFDCEILKAIQLIETGAGPYEYSCNSQGYCGAFQVGGGLQLGLGIPLDKFKTIPGNAEAAIRQMQMRMCQASCRQNPRELGQDICSVCNTSKWTPELKDKYSLGPDEFDKAAYYHYGSDQPDDATQKRWGEGFSYADAIEYVVKNGKLP
ncbi:hypothetical protein KKB06_01270 [Patescibacteria group bacterium]|nr:hypothetical protein [Patescibacteria group bacterium]